MKNTKIRTYILSISIFAVFFWGSQFFFGQHSIDVSIDNQVIQLSGGKDYNTSISQGEIVDCKIIESLPAGTLVDGYDGATYHYGNYKNSEFGNYQMYITEKVNSYIYIEKTDGTILIFNYESDSVTTQLYDAISNFYL